MKKLFFMAIAILIPSMADSSAEGWKKVLQSNSPRFIDITESRYSAYEFRAVNRKIRRWVATALEYHKKLSSQNIPDAVYVTDPVDPTKTMYFLLSDLASRFKHYGASHAALELIRNIIHVFHLSYSLALLDRQSYPKKYDQQPDSMSLEEVEELAKIGGKVTWEQVGTLLIDALNSPVNEKGLKAVSQYLKNPRFVEQMIEALKKLNYT